MTKPLHEQLRECEGIGDLQQIADCESVEERDVYNAIADRIENEYYLLPCDEEGKPWKYMDECVYGENTYSVVGIDNERNVCVFYEGEYKWVHASRIKRPDPPVLDADGVPCKVGDTVWSVIDREPDPLKVKKLAKNNKFKADGSPDTLYFIASSFTHEKPVFDANGVRICKGDTVWTKEDYHGIVVSVEPERVGADFGVVDGMNLGICHEHPSNLSHSEWDSLEKLRDRMHEKWGQAWAKHEPIDESELHGFIDDLTALIERGA